MKTIVKSGDAEVQIGDSLPFVIIGEKINPTGSKKLAAALRERCDGFIRDLARSQVAAGADILDVNVGLPDLDETTILPDMVRILTDTIQVPLCLDSTNPAALDAALKVAPGRPLVNSVNGEAKSLATILPIVKEYQVPVIGLAMDERGVPGDTETRMAIAGRIIDRAVQIGIPAEDILIDPLVLAVGSDDKAGAVTLQTIQMVREAFGVNIVLGASNVSFGLPDRRTINRAFLALAIGKGATCAIADPIQVAPIIRATDLLVGRDAYARRFISYWRAHKTEGS